MSCLGHLPDLTLK